MRCARQRWLIIVIGTIIIGNTIEARDLSLERQLYSYGRLANLETKVVRQIQRDADSVYYHYLLANVYLQRFLNNPLNDKLLQQSLKLAKQTIYLDAGSELGYLVLASIHDAIGKTIEAQEILKIFNQQLSIKKSWRYFLVKAKVSLSESSLSQSIKLLDKSLSVEGSLPEAIIPYIVVLLDAKYLGQQSALINELRAWQRRQPHPLFEQYLAAIYLDGGNYRRAEKIYNRLLMADPANREAKRNKAIILYQHRQTPDRAHRLLTSLLEEENRSSSETATINLHLGLINLQQHRDRQANNNFLVALSIHPESSTLLELIVATYKRQKKFHQLAILLEELSYEQPGNVLYHTMLGNVWLEQIKDYRQAVLAYENATVLDPYSSKLYAARGLAHYHLQEFEQALRMFGQARALDISDATNFYNEACIYALLSRGEEAVSALQKAIELDGRLRDHARNDTDFDKIRALPAFLDTVSD